MVMYHFMMHNSVKHVVTTRESMFTIIEIFILADEGKNLIIKFSLGYLSSVFIIPGSFVYFVSFYLFYIKESVYFAY